MSLNGTFRLERASYGIDEPIPLKLELSNDGTRDLFVFVPRGRGDGVRIKVLDGDRLAVASLDHEPEPGLVGELRLGPGRRHAWTFPLHKWLGRRTPGSYRLECSIAVEVADRSVRERDREPKARRVEVVTELELNLVA